MRRFKADASGGGRGGCVFDRWRDPPARRTLIASIIHGRHAPSAHTCRVRVRAPGCLAVGRAGASRRPVSPTRILPRGVGADRHGHPRLRGPGEVTRRGGAGGPARTGRMERRLRFRRPRGRAPDDPGRPLPHRLGEQARHQRGGHDAGGGGPARPGRPRLPLHPELRNSAGGRGHRHRPDSGAGPSRRHRPTAPDSDRRALLRIRLARSARSIRPPAWAPPRATAGTWPTRRSRSASRWIAWARCLWRPSRARHGCTDTPRMCWGASSSGHPACRLTGSWSNGSSPRSGCTTPGSFRRTRWAGGSRRCTP